MTKSSRFSCAIRLAALVSPATALAAPAETILYSFPDTHAAPAGELPASGLVLGPDGALYGTTKQGGGAPCDCGTVFRLAPPAAGQTVWTQTVIHRFLGYPKDGGVAFANLIFDAQGNLYGTTTIGGPAQYGTLFMLAPPGAGATEWHERILHNFAGPPGDGSFPHAAVTFDSTGNLYGTATLGGASNQGAVFRLATDGSWSLPHSFAGGKDGAQPEGSLIFAASGEAFGTTTQDGVHLSFGGTVFSLAQDGTETVLHSFSGRVFCCPMDFGGPSGQLVLDGAGNLYGTAQNGGDGSIMGVASNAGGVYRLTPPRTGSSAWTETLLHSFNENSADGGSPTGGVTADSAGNLFGVTPAGGVAGSGTAYRLSPPQGGGTRWTETQLHQFTSFPDGDTPQGTLAMDKNGTLYGATMSGTSLSFNAREVGTLFQIIP